MIVGDPIWLLNSRNTLERAKITLIESDGIVHHDHYSIKSPVFVEGRGKTFAIGKLDAVLFCERNAVYWANMKKEIEGEL